MDENRSETRHPAAPAHAAPTGAPAPAGAPASPAPAGAPAKKSQRK